MPHFTLHCHNLVISALFDPSLITEVDKGMADSLAQLTARAQAAENAVDGLAR